jgi:nitrate reductase NapE component
MVPGMSSRRRTILFIVLAFAALCVVAVIDVTGAAAVVPVLEAFAA